MRWFKTPEQYLQGFAGFDVRVYADSVDCPRCGNGDAQKLKYRGNHRWQCKRWSCRCAYEPVRTEHRAPISAEDYVLSQIKGEYKWAEHLLSLGGTVPGGTAVKGPGLTDNIAILGALAGDVKDAAVLEGLQMYGRHQQRQAQQSELAQFQAEYEQALELADQYFGISQRQAAAETDARREDMREMARVIAQEMVAEVRRQTVS